VVDFDPESKEADKDAKETWQELINVCFKFKNKMGVQYENFKISNLTNFKNFKNSK